MMQARRLLAAAGFVFFPALALAAGSSAQQGQQGQQGQAQQPKPAAAQPSPLDVEELNDELARYAGQRVSVEGEVEEWLDPRSFVLEGGGLFNDEIAVVIPPNAQGLDPQRLREDADIVVSGTVRATPLIELQRELSWDLDPQLEVELQGVKYFLVADRITRQRD